MIFVPWAWLQELVGAGFLRPLATMAMVSAVLNLAIAGWRRETVREPVFTHYDEAAWFLLIGVSLHLAAGPAPGPVVFG